MTLIGKCRNQNCRDDVADLPSKVSLRRRRVILKEPKYHHDLDGKLRVRARIHRRSLSQLRNFILP